MWWSALCLPPDTPCTELSWWALGFTPRVACVDEAVLMELSVAGPGAQGDGRLVVARGDGMPIELRMEVRYAASKNLQLAVGANNLFDVYPTNTPRGCSTTHSTSASR